MFWCNCEVVCLKFNSLQIDEFRGIKNLHLRDLQNVNLLLGDNDAGKTSVLEAISMFENLGELDSVIRNSRMRMYSSRVYLRDSYRPFESFVHLFPFGQEHKHLKISATIDGQCDYLEIDAELVRVLKTYTEKELKGYAGFFSKNENASVAEREVVALQGRLQTTSQTSNIEIDETYNYRIPVGISKRDSFPIEYMAPGDHLSGRSGNSIFKTSKKQELEIVTLLRLIDPEIEGFKLQPNDLTGGTNQVVEHRRYGDVPLYTYGDGVKKMFALASCVLFAKDGVLMIDEIETSLQASNLEKVFSWLLSACKLFNVQLFVTTHSLESVASLVSCAVVDTESELACFRLEKDEDGVYAKRFSEDELDSMVNGRGLDVR